MKTIKIDEHAHNILTAYKYFFQCKTYSETIKKLYNYIENDEKIKNLKKNYKENKLTPYNITPQEKEIPLPIGTDTNEK